MKEENKLLLNKHVLLYIHDKQFIENLPEILQKELRYIVENFCGRVFIDKLQFTNYENNATIYMCGNLDKLTITSNTPCYQIDLITCNGGLFTKIHPGRVPININNIGVFYRCYFTKQNIFSEIENAHKFQSLKESEKPGIAYRTGIYLSNVRGTAGELKFNLLRCSTNLNGPTENFQDIDKELIKQTQIAAGDLFDKPVEFNHVLAQIYENKILLKNGKNIERKAKIKSHSDKTKDMPAAALIAFCSFYKDLPATARKSAGDFFDYCHKKSSIFTVLRFKSKLNSEIINIKLYPNSLFLISLETNRLYTHEIIPAAPQIDKIPTRMGYIIRCSKTAAIFKEGKAHICEDEKENLIEMRAPAAEDIAALKEAYARENSSHEIITYDKIYFSLNAGDYKEPAIGNKSPGLSV